MPRREVPASASTVEAGAGAKLFAPSAARNAAVLGELLARIAPAQGDALELASGTGQHVVAFAARLPHLVWHPSDIDAVRRASIAAHIAASGLGNVAAPLGLDATAPGWGARNAGKSLVLVVNLLHLISTPEAATLIDEAARALAPGGLIVIYGPFMRAGELTSDGDARFHASLIAQDGEIGYKDDFDTMDMLQHAGLEMVEVVEMPANNLALVARRA